MTNYQYFYSNSDEKKVDLYRADLAGYRLPNEERIYTIQCYDKEHKQWRTVTNRFSSEALRVSLTLCYVPVPSQLNKLYQILFR